MVRLAHGVHGVVELGIDLERLEVVWDGLLVTPAPVEGVADVVPGDVVLGVDGDGPLEPWNGLEVIAKVVLGVPPIVEEDLVLVVYLDGPLVGLDRVLQAVHLVVGVSEVVPRVAIGRVDTDGLPIALDGHRHEARGEEGEAPVVPDLLVVQVPVEGLVVALDGQVQLLQVEVGVALGLPDLGVRIVQFQRTGVQSHRPAGLAHLVKQQALVVLEVGRLADLRLHFLYLLEDLPGLCIEHHQLDHIIVSGPVLAVDLDALDIVLDGLLLLAHVSEGVSPVAPSDLVAGLELYGLPIAVHSGGVVAHGIEDNTSVVPGDNVLGVPVDVSVVRVDGGLVVAGAEVLLRRVEEGLVGGGHQFFVLLGGLHLLRLPEDRGPGRVGVVPGAGRALLSSTFHHASPGGAGRPLHPMAKGPYLGSGR